MAAAQRAHGAHGLIVWVIAANKAARAFYERLGAEILVEQPFTWDGMDLVEAGYGWRDLPPSPRPAARRSRCIESTEVTQESDDMTIKVGINGFGRIGRMVLRAAVRDFPDIEVVGINDLLEPDYLAYMLQFDSVHGRFKGTIAVEGSTLIVNGKRIRLTAVKDPAELKWGEIGADVVVESTGLFLTKETAEKHLAAGAKKVDHVGAVEGRDADVRVRRQRQDVRRAGDHLQRVVHDQLPRAGRQGAQRHVGHQARPHDDRARGDRDAEDRRRPVEQGLARRPRHPREHHPVVDRRGQGRRQGDSRAQQEADRHVVPRADVRRVRRRPHGRAREARDVQGDLRGDEGRLARAR